MNAGAELLEEVPPDEHSGGGENKDVLEKQSGEDEVTQETFSPTVLEYMMRSMTLESCNADVMLCLKGVEPILHKYKPMLIKKTQLPSLFASTLTHKSLLPLRDRLLDYQSTSTLTE